MCSVVVVSLVVRPFLVNTVVCIACTQPLLVCPLHVVVFILPSLPYLHVVPCSMLGVGSVVPCLGITTLTWCFLLRTPVHPYPVLSSLHRPPLLTLTWHT
jgi:hypothetical protein